MRELGWMAESRSREAWSQTSFICASIINSNPFRSGEPISPQEINPFLAKQAKSQASESSDERIKIPVSLFARAIVAAHTQ